MDEIWKSIPGYEGFYEASSTGRIRSIPRISITGAFLPGVVRKQCAQKSGHLGVGFSKDGVIRTINTHKIIALTFLGERPKGMFIRHANGIPTDNRVANLSYDTPRQNNLDRYVHGVSPTGDESHLSKYTETQVAEIWALKGVMSSRLASVKVGINARYIRRIWSREIRKHDARISY